MKYRVAWNECGNCEIGKPPTKERPCTQWMKPYRYWFDFEGQDALAVAFEMRHWDVCDKSVRGQFGKVPGFVSSANPETTHFPFGKRNGGN
jgi:hypothetical protein